MIPNGFRLGMTPDVDRTVTVPPGPDAEVPIHHQGPFQECWAERAESMDHFWECVGPALEGK